MSWRISLDRGLWLRRGVTTVAGLAALSVLAPHFMAGRASAAFDPPYVLSAAIPAPPGEKITSFDISWVDPVLERYYLGSRTTKSVIVVDTTTSKFLTQFKPGFTGFTGNNSTSGPDGVITVDHKEVWVGDAPSRVFVLNATTGAQVGPPISVGASPNRADELCYDPINKIVAIVNNADTPPFITFISTTSKTVLGKVVFDGQAGRPNATNGAEQCQWNPRDGKIYVSIPEINGPGDNSVPGGVVVFDAATRAVLRTMIVPLASCTGPQGLAIGPPPQIALGCAAGIIGGNRANNNAIINESTGATIAALTGVGGGDEIWYNPGNNKYFMGASNAPGGPSLYVIDAQTFAVQKLSTGTASGAHSVAVDPIRNLAYVPVSSASTSGLCSSKGAVDANGCILVFAPSPATPELACYTGAALGDLNSDGRADVLWRRDDGAVSAWLMNGTTVSSATALGTAPPDFFVAGTGDINGDGTADVVWRRTTDGAVSVWLMTGDGSQGGANGPGPGTVGSAVAIGTVTTDWHIIAVRDFDGDGKADILWRRGTDGAISIWFMNGATVASAKAVGTIGLEWEIFGVGDFNNDRKADILWRRGDGATSVWLMDGATVMSATAIAVVSTDWHVFGVADFNGDGFADVLWRRNDGAVSLWFMNGSTVASAVAVANVATDFTIAGTGDLDGNRTADLLWRSNTGAITFWLMNGATITSVVGSGSLTPDWHSCLHEPTGPIGTGAETPFW